ncbi:MAG: hypothetical protein ACLFV2_05100 [Desulfurivibrionaceae bacterium]
MKKGIYLARDILSPEPDYYIRQTCRDEEPGCLHHRELFRLGKNPGDYLVYIEDRGYYVCDTLVEAVAPYAGKETEDILEDLLWPFVRRDIRVNLGKFGNRRGSLKTSALTREELATIEKEIHIFDRRRLHYFWYGAIDQGRLFQMPAKLCRRLLGMSRDQKEQYFLEQEKILAVDEIKEYIYTIFNLQQYFPETISRIMPQGLDQEKMDDCFLREICRLNQDKSFWQGMAVPEGLSLYLVRYVILFFDYDFGSPRALDDYIRQFINSRRQFRFPERKSGINLAEAGGVFSESPEKLKKMSKTELTSLFRRKAKNMHPDAGGEHGDFIKLVEVYEKLLKTKK